jgi:diaminopimelate epimerase
MKFAKIHSLGNDFLIVEEAETKGLAEIGRFASRICDRHTGVGADGLLLI